MPQVLRWLSTKFNCGSQIASLLAATAGGDIDLVRGIIKSEPDLGLFNFQGGASGGGRSALTVAAERGDLDILRVIYEGAVTARGEAYAKQSLNVGAERGQTPLMRACTYGTPQHVECVVYLLAVGADPFAETSRGETCLHLAAKNAYIECLSEILSADVSIGGATPVRLADAVLPYSPPVKFIEMRNATGFTALHLAAIKNSSTCMQILLGAGAAMDSGILGAANTPTLARGSTALHIAAARGSFPCCNALLDFEPTVPGLNLRRIRNQRNLKASHLARLAGFDELAQYLKDRQGRPPPRQRRRRRSDRESAAPPSTQKLSSPEAVMAQLVLRGRLLLALRRVGLSEGIDQLPREGLASVQHAMIGKDREQHPETAAAKDEIASAVVQFTTMWQQGKLDESQTGSLLQPLVPADMPVAKLPDDILGDEGGGDSFAAAAMVQAALNAMAYFSPSGKPLDLPPTQLKPTSPIAAAIVVEVALRKLVGKGSNASQHSTSTTAASLIHSVTQTARQNATEGKESRKGHSKRRQAVAQGACDTAEGLPEVGKSPGQRKVGGRRGQPDKARRHRVAPTDSSARSSGPDEQSTGPRPGRREQQGAAGLGSRGSNASEGGSSFEQPGLQPRVLSSYASHPQSVTSSEALPFSTSTSPTVSPHTSLRSLPGNSETGELLGEWEEFGTGSRVEEGWHTAHRSKHGQGQASKQEAAPAGLAHSTASKPHPFLKSKLGRPPRLESSHLSEDRGTDSPNGSLGSNCSGQQEALVSVLLGPAEEAAPSTVSWLEPVHSGLLATNHTSATATEDDKDEEDEDDSEKEEGGEVLLEEMEGMDQGGRCAICMDHPLQVGISTCLHKICYGCSYQLCSRGLGTPICPFCRGDIATFVTIGQLETLAAEQGL